MAVSFISSVQPTAGPSSGGDLVRLVGTGFSNSVRVLFGGVPATVVSVRDEAGQRVDALTSPGVCVILLFRWPDAFCLGEEKT